MRRIGTIVGYIGAIVILGGLLVGGIRFAQLQLTSHNQPPAVATQTSDENTTSSDTSPRESDHATPAPQQSPQPPTVSELPQTGTADSFLSVLGLGLITVFAITYVRSRRLVPTL